MIAAELDSADLAKLTVEEMLKRRIIINRTSDTVLRFLPPYIIERKHVDEAIKALDEILTEQGRGCKHGDSNRRRKHPWLAEQPWSAGRQQFPCRKIRIFWPRLRGWQVRTCARSRISRAAKCARIVKLGHDVKMQPARVSPCARREADGADV